jgi:hypothetical protein
MMLSLSSGFNYYLHRGVTDFRCGMHSLSGLVRRELGQDPLNGAVYIFFNRSRTQVKWNCSLKLSPLFSCNSSVQGNLHARFLGESAQETGPSYPTTKSLAKRTMLRI